MNVHEQIKEYIATQPETKRRDMQELRGMILELMTKCRLWFLDGKDENGRTVSNPNAKRCKQRYTSSRNTTWD